MRYQVRLINNPEPFFVEASQFHTNSGGSITFFTERLRNRGGNDQWGNPRTMPTIAPVAFFNGVSSVIEMPDEDVIGAALEGVNNRMFGQVPADRFFVMDEATDAWAGEFAANPIEPIQVDGDGVNWDAQRHE
jgi:hypothetical protein